MARRLNLPVATDSRELEALSRGIQGFGAPIGFGESISNLGRTAARIVEPEAQRKALEQARADAGEMELVRNADGTLQPPEKKAKENFPSLYSLEYDRIQEERFLQTISLDTRSRLKEFATEYKADPAGFQTAADGYINEITESLPPEVRPAYEIDAKTIAGQYWEGIADERAKMDFDNAKSIHFESMNEIQRDALSYAASGGEDPATLNAYTERLKYMSEQSIAYGYRTQGEADAILRQGRNRVVMMGEAGKLMRELSGYSDPEQARLFLENRRKDLLEGKNMSAYGQSADLTPSERKEMVELATGWANIQIDKLSAVRAVQRANAKRRIAEEGAAMVALAMTDDLEGMTTSMAQMVDDMQSASDPAIKQAYAEQLETGMRIITGVEERTARMGELQDQGAWIHSTLTDLAKHSQNSITLMRADDLFGKDWAADPMEIADPREQRAAIRRQRLVLSELEQELASLDTPEMGMVENALGRYLDNVAVYESVRGEDALSDTKGFADMRATSDMAPSMTVADNTKANRAVVDEVYQRTLYPLPGGDQDGRFELFEMPSDDPQVRRSMIGRVETTKTTGLVPQSLINGLARGVDRLGPEFANPEALHWMAWSWQQMEGSRNPVARRVLIKELGAGRVAALRALSDAVGPVSYGEDGLRGGMMTPESMAQIVTARENISPPMTLEQMAGDPKIKMRSNEGLETYLKGFKEFWSWNDTPEITADAQALWHERFAANVNKFSSIDDAVDATAAEMDMDVFGSRLGTDATAPNLKRADKHVMRYAPERFPGVPENLRPAWGRHLKVWFGDRVAQSMKAANPGLPDKLALGDNVRLNFVETDSATGNPLYSFTVKTRYGWQTVPFSSDMADPGIVSLDEVYEAWQTERAEAANVRGGGRDLTDTPFGVM